ncbi:MAG: S-layer homology domain-containing protein [Eubacteriales bacterium]
MKTGSKKILAIGIALMILLSFSSGSLAAAGRVSAPEINFTDLGQAAWAQKNIIKMKIRGIVAGYSDGTFRPNAQVLQAEAVIMALREMGAVTESGSDSSVVLPKEFGEDIPAWAKESVAAAWRRGLIKPGENNFKWNSPANRAWTARLAIRMAGLEQQALGESSQLSFSDNTSIPAWARGYVSFVVSKGIMVGYKDGTFQPNRALTRAEIATVLAKSEKYMNLADVRRGTIDDINVDNIIIFDSSDNLFRIYIADRAWIYKGDVTAPFEDLEEGDVVSISLIDSNVAGFVDIESGTGDTGQNEQSRDIVIGEVVSVNTDNDQIRIEDKDGLRTTYDVTSDADFVIDGHSNPDLGDIEVGDEVVLRLENGEANRIEVLSGSNTDTVTGEVVTVDIAKDEIRIEDEDGVRKTYDVTSDADFIVDGHSNPDLGDIEVGDDVELRLKNGDADRIEVLTGSSDFIIGELYSVSTSNETIRVKDREGHRTTYDVKSNADIEVSGDNNADLGDLDTGNPVKIIIVNDEVTDIVQGTMLEGNIRSRSTSSDTVRFESSDGDTDTYDVNPDAIIEYDNESLDLSDLNIGDEVELYTFYDDDEVYQIIVTDQA